MSSALVLSADPPQAHHHPSGTGVGPILSRSLFQDSRSWPGVLAMCIVSSGVGYILVSSTAWGHAVGLLVFLAHMAGGSQWVLSTVGHPAGRRKNPITPSILARGEGARQATPSRPELIDQFTDWVIALWDKR